MVSQIEPTPSCTSATRVLNREQIASLILKGHVLVLHRRTVYRLNRWLTSHPGGALAILHFVGRDATDELEAYHPMDTIVRMKAFAVATIAESDWSDETGWKPLTPPVQLGWPVDPELYQSVEGLDASLRRSDEPTDLPKAFLPLSRSALEPPLPPPSIDPQRQHRLSLEYRKLHDEVIAAGLYEPKPIWLYRWELVRYSLLFIAFAWRFATATQTC